MAGPLFRDNSFSIFLRRDCSFPVNDLEDEVGIDSARETVGRVRPEWYRGRFSVSASSLMVVMDGSVDEDRDGGGGGPGNWTERRDSDRVGLGAGGGGGGIARDASKLALELGEGDRSEDGGVGRRKGTGTGAAEGTVEELTSSKGVD